MSAHPRYVSTPMTGDSTFSAATATLDESFLPDSDDEEVLSDESASASDYDEEDATLDMSFDKDLAAQILQDETSTTSMNDTDGWLCCCGRMFVCLFVCLLHVCLFVCLFVCLLVLSPPFLENLS